MSETTGGPAPDPKREEWLKQFKGLPETFDPSDLHTDRLHVEALDESRPYAMTPMGEINALGELAREAKRQSLDSSGKTPTAQRTISTLVLLALLLPLLLGALGVVASVFITFE